MSPDPYHPGTALSGQSNEIRLNKSQLIASLNCELDQLRQEIIKKRRGIFKRKIENQTKINFKSK